MFSGTQLLQVGQALGMLQRPVPLFGARQEDRDWQLRLDIDLQVAAVAARVIRLPGVIVGGVQPDIFLIAGLPIENSIRRLAKRGSSECGDQQKYEKGGHFGVSHSNSIETPREDACKASLQDCLVGVS